MLGGVVVPEDPTDTVTRVSDDDRPTSVADSCVGSTGPGSTWRSRSERRRDAGEPAGLGGGGGVIGAFGAIDVQKQRLRPLSWRVS